MGEEQRLKLELMDVMACRQIMYKQKLNEHGKVGCLTITIGVFSNLKAFHIGKSCFGLR